MNDSTISVDLKEVRGCPDCGATAVRVSFEARSFSFGTDNPVELTATIPLWTCEACGFSYTDGRGEELEHEAICRHLKVLTPREIRALRERHSLSRAEIGKLTRFGEASIKRWERGAVIQNASADRFLRALDDHAVLERLRLLDSELESTAPNGQQKKLSVASSGNDIGANQPEDMSGNVFQLKPRHDRNISQNGGPREMRLAASSRPHVDIPDSEADPRPQIYESRTTTHGSIGFFDDGSTEYIGLDPDTSPTELELGIEPHMQTYPLRRSEKWPEYFEAEGLTVREAMKILGRYTDETVFPASWR